MDNDQRTNCGVCQHKEIQSIPKSTKGLSYEKNSGINTYSVTGTGTTTDKDIVIPSTYNNLPVTSIGRSSFSNCSNLTSITIPSSVTSIGQDAFACCSSLTSVTISNSTTCIVSDVIIGDNAFYGCSSLTSIEIPSSVNSIGEWAFSRCSNLTNITIPGSITSIGGYAFYECSNLTNVYYEGKILNWCSIIFKTIYSDFSSNPMAYANHFYLKNNNYAWEEVTSIEISDSIARIGDYQFYGFNNITSFIIPTCVTSIGEYTFSECSSLKEVYYKGTFSEWYCITIGQENSNLNFATIYCYSETKPTFPGKYWHYVDGVVAKW